MAYNNLTIVQDINNIHNRIDSPEEGLGKILNQPFSAMNSGSRKILTSTQLEHAIPLTNSEPAIIQTGYEIRFGDYSSSLIKAKSELIVEAIIPKFKDAPTHDYYIIFRNDKNKTLELSHRTMYQHNSESNGILFNNSYMDELSINSVVRENETIRKSTSFDEFNNRQDGINLNTGYIATLKNTQDSIILAKTAAKKLTSPFIHKIQVMINENDIPLNRYGYDGIYKSFSDIGETIKDGIVMVLRRAIKQRALYSQAYDRLSELFMSDDKIVAKGTIIDIDCYCNNPELLFTNEYNSQIKYYYDQKQIFNMSLVSAVETLQQEYPEYKMDFELQILFHEAKQLLNGAQFEKDGKIFSNTIIEFTVLEHIPMRVGDKMTNRFGGKGVVSFIIDDELMPLDNLGNRLEVIVNQSTSVNRLNPGQLIEHSFNHIQERVINYCQSELIDPDESISMITELLSIISKDEAKYFQRYTDSLRYNAGDLYTFLDTIYDMGHIYLSSRPITDCLCLNDLREAYRRFPWIKLSYIQSPIFNSNNEPRFVGSLRPIVTGKIYYLRLKQVADEKLSATSLSSVNIRNQNTKSKNSKNYKAPRSNTPIQFGDMEQAEFQHTGIENSISNLLLYSVSPKARRLFEQLLYGDPFDVDIRLDDESQNTNVTIVYAYMKTKGIRIDFKKIPKVSKPLFTRTAVEKKQLFRLVESWYDIDKHNQKLHGTYTGPQPLARKELFHREK